MMTSSEIRQKYFDFFKERGHTIIPSAALVPDNDPTTLFTGSGMQPLLPYLLGEKHPSGTRLADSQKCFRAEDIEEIGNNRHTTFFEMLGNWSLGDYFKQEQLPWFFEFLTDEVGLDPARLYVTVFDGAQELDIPRDDESIKIWQKLFTEKNVSNGFQVIGSEENGYKTGMKDGARIFSYDAQKNWWSRSGVPQNMPTGEPGGPDSEMFYDFGTKHDLSFGEQCHPNCDCGRFMEIGNSVFMEYIKREDGSFAQLPQKNVDFGGGLERITTAANNEPDVFQIDIFKTIIAEIERLSGRTYTTDSNKRSYRIIADHLRGAVMMIAQGITPGSTEQNYFVRRLLRRSIQHMDVLGMQKNTLHTIVPALLELHGEYYSQELSVKDTIVAEIQSEEERFRLTLARGMKEFEKLSADNISGKDAFNLYQTYGFPFEMTEELATERNISVDKEGFRAAMSEHQKTSRTGAEQKFKGGLADSGEVTTQLHSTTHLMLAGLRKYLGSDVHQAGSNITAERTRFDFTYPQKVERDVLDKVEAYVNDAIAAGAVRIVEEMPKEEAQAAGVEGSFWERYPDIVHVYTFKSEDGTIWSRELCGGPHVENTADIKGTFKIVKEGASSAGVRRVRGVLEKN